MILNIYKPKGITSYDVVHQIKRILNLKKVGHAGTLDPLAEGVLIVLTDKDTKQQDKIMHMTKEYIADIGFGVTTDTYDLEMLPELVEIPVLSDLESKFKLILPKFIGEIEQHVPFYAAKKVAGVPLYKRARKGQLIEKDTLPKKLVLIKDIEVLSFSQQLILTNQGEKLIPVVKIRVSCSQGTFIRSLAYDFGSELGYGGVLVKLVRSKVGDYILDKSVRVEELEF